MQSLYQPSPVAESCSHKALRFTAMFIGCVGALLIVIGCMWIAQAIHDTGGISAMIEEIAR